MPFFTTVLVSFDEELSKDTNFLLIETIKNIN